MKKKDIIKSEVCEKCMKKCNTLINIDLENKLVCEICFSNFYMSCDSCGRKLSIKNSHQKGDSFFYSCDECNSKDEL